MPQQQQPGQPEHSMVPGLIKGIIEGSCVTIEVFLPTDSDADTLLAASPGS